MSYSPYAVLGSLARIKANQNKIKTTKKEEKEKEEIDYTELLRKTYFPHLVKKDIDK